MRYSHITFRVKFYTQFSESIRIVGNHHELGSWNPCHGVVLTTNPQIYPYWESETPIEVPKDGKVFQATTLKEDVRIKYVSSSSLQNLESTRRMKKSQQAFNPFMKAQNSFSSDSDLLENSLSDGYICGKYVPSDEDDVTSDTQEKDNDDSFEIFDNHFEGKRKNSDLQNRMGGFGKILEGLDDERPDIFSVLYKKRLYEQGAARNKPISVIDSESFVDLTPNILEEDLVELPNDQSVTVVCFKLPITVTLVNSEAETVSKKWNVTEDINLQHQTLYKFRRQRTRGMTWIGWIGIHVEEKYREQLSKYLCQEYNCIPIFLEESLCNEFLFGYCNTFLYDAFFGVLDFNTISCQEDYIDIYDKVNQTFAAQALDHCKKDSLIIVQDYYLMMVPKYISQNNTGLSLTYMFRTPFPAVNVMKAFQNLKELSESFLCVDLFCFVSNESMNAFSNFCIQTTGAVLMSEKGGHIYLLKDGRKIYLKTVYPCIDSPSILKIKNTPSYREKRDFIREKYKEKNLLLAISYFTKFEILDNLLQAAKTIFETQKHHQYHLSVLHSEDMYRFDSQEPSHKETVENFKAKIENMNKYFSEQGLNSHIELLIQPGLGQDEKLAMMETSQLLLAFSPYIENSYDALDYIMTKSKEMQYADQDNNDNFQAGIILNNLLQGAKQLSLPVRVNALSKIKLIEGMERALSKSKDTARLLLASDLNHIADYLACDQFDDSLVDIKRTQIIKSKLTLVNSGGNEDFKIISVKDGLQRMNGQAVLDAFKNAKRKVIICSYEGTLVENSLSNFVGSPNLLPKGFRDIKQLAADPSVAFFVVSEKKVETLATMFESGYNVSLLAENGFFYKMSYETHWCNMYDCDWSWKNIVQGIMQKYATRTGGSKVEVRDSSIVWSCHDINNEIARVQEEKLANHLALVLTHAENIEIVRGRSSVEVKAGGVNKGVAVDLIMEREKLVKGTYPDFVLCIGATGKDEAMFERIAQAFHNNVETKQAKVFSCSVGQKQTKANNYVEKVEDVHKILGMLSLSITDGEK